VRAPLPKAKKSVKGMASRLFIEFALAFTRRRFATHRHR